MPTLGIDPDRVEEFHELKEREDYDPLDYWYKEINPFIKGMEIHRKAVLVTLASGDLGTSKRGRVSTLLVGPPGTAKSDIRNFIVYKLNRIGEYPCVGVGPKSSEAGLKYDARGEGTPGALAQADKGVIGIDELDKFKKSEREALLESMAEGKYEVMTGDKRKTLSARVRVVATANSTDPIEEPLLDRFDFILETDLPSPDKEQKITDYIYDNFFDEEVKRAGRLRDYLMWVRVSKPVPEEGAMEKIKDIKNMYIDIVKENGYEPDVREKESLLRTALTIARLNREKLKPEHYLQALRLQNPDKGTTIDSIERAFL